MRVTSRNGLQPLLIRCVTSIDTDTPKQSLVLSVKKGPLHYSLQRSNGNRNRVRVHLYSSETKRVSLPDGFMKIQFNVHIAQRQRSKKTRVHSSRMRTVRTVAMSTPACTGQGGCMCIPACTGQKAGVCPGGVSQHALRQTPPREQND